MTPSHGSFVWYELMTTDLSAAEAFYRRVLGWTAQDAGMPQMSYTLCLAGESRVAGLMDLPEDARKAGAGPSWIGYVAVDDVDAYAAQFEKEGGAVHHKPSDIPGIGRFAVVSDPDGAALALFKGAGEAPPPASADAPGHVGWRELYAGDLTRAFPFYAKLFGWTKAEAVDMGEMGVYQLFACGGTTIGGMMTKPPMVPRAHWGYYFNVAALDPATDRVASAGGSILNGPMQVPGGSWIAQCRDPQGAHFSLVAPHR